MKPPRRLQSPKTLTAVKEAKDGNRLFLRGNLNPQPAQGKPIPCIAISVNRPNVTKPGPAA